MATQVRVKKWGSSMAILIPRQFARMRRIDVDSVVDLEDIKVVASPRPRYKLSHLMSQYKSKHRHGEWNVGQPIGNEIW